MGSKHFISVGDERLEALLRVTEAKGRARAELVVDSREALATLVSAELGRNVPQFTVRGWILELVLRGAISENATVSHGPVTRRVTPEDVIHWAKTMLTPAQRREIGAMDDS